MAGCWLPPLLKKRSPMQVFINGTSTVCESGCTLAQLLVRLELPAEQCATAINGVFVPRDQRANSLLKENDHVMTFEPITGG
jgi:sulfur carrier protein